MTDMETKIEVETEDFTDELSDEALDREGAGAVELTAVGCRPCGGCG